MFIKNLQIVGFRALRQADFTFQKGMNLIVGVNGVGKTTVLDALRVCLSRLLPKVTVSQAKGINSPPENLITVGEEALQFSCDIDLDSNVFNVLIRRQRTLKVVEQEGKSVTVPDTFVITPDPSTLTSNSNDQRDQPLALYLSTRRSAIIDAEPNKAATVGGQAAAFAESLLPNREINLRIIAQWFKAQEVLGAENAKALKHIEVLRDAITEFLPEYENLQVIETDGQSSFSVYKTGVPFQINQLSDGERGIIAMILDLARRLSQANPDSENPLHGTGVVLIDEIDLHLHPKWQRSVVDNFTRTFPNCQFIVTTHSPQIIGEVKPDRITIIGDTIYRPSSSFGMDSSRVLEEIMDTNSRNVDVDQLITSISRKIDSLELGEAKQLLNELKRILKSDDPEVIRSETMIDFLESDIIE